MKKLFIKISIVLLIFLLGVLAVVPFNKHYESKVWMKSLEDNTQIVDLSIPGTHDSGSLHNIFDFFGKCQELTIENQLKVGVRFLDIRLQMRNNEFYVVHSIIDQKIKFDDCLKVISDFIENNPTEFIIMSIKKDADTINSTKDFDQTLIELLSKNDNIKFDNQMPSTVGVARGNIYILNRFTNKDIGIPAYNNWRDSESFYLDNIYVQDNYRVLNTDEKITDIIKAFEVQQKENTLVINFMSCYLEKDIFPLMYALKPSLVINDWLRENITKFDSTGILLADFMTEDLAESIYMRNFK